MTIFTDQLCMTGQLCFVTVQSAVCFILIYKRSIALQTADLDLSPITAWFIGGAWS